jgi:hypothetical protein
MVEGQAFEERSWEEFRGTGLSVFVNTFLHIFGWCLVCELEGSKDVVRVFPAKTKARGFFGDAYDDAYAKVSKFIKDDG